MRYVFLWFFVLASAAEAKVSVSTSYSYFKISGHTAGQIYQSLLAHAKGPGGHDAYATTSTRIIQKGTYSTGKSCGVRTYDTNLNFAINLPRLAASKASAPIQNSWQDFAGVLKRHEEHHRSLWLSCAREFNRKVLELKESSCANLKNKFKILWKATETSCRKLNDDFDRAEQLRFPHQPFIQLLLRRR
jgi:predicted secreted Zn-dependent protease